MNAPDLAADLERRADEADKVNATAPLAMVFRQFAEELRGLEAESSGYGDRLTSDPDIMLRAPQVAERLGVAVRTVYASAKGWPFTRRYPGGSVRFSELGLERWLARQK